jgi:hypothetical protein
MRSSSTACRFWPSGGFATLAFPLTVLPDSPGMLTVDPQHLAAAQERDRAAPAAEEFYVRLRVVGYSRLFDHVGDKSPPIAAAMPRCGERQS